MYRITLKNPSGRLIHARERTRMDNAVAAGVEAVDRLHDILGTARGIARLIDEDCARGWNPRQGEVVIERLGWILTLGKR